MQIPSSTSFWKANNSASFRILVALCLSVQSAEASPLCSVWESSQVLAPLPSSVKEASGLAISSRFENRLYHINDSGDGPYIYATNRQGSLLEKIEIKGERPTDNEDLSVGECGLGREQPCLFVGDIGDNDLKREEISVVVIREKAKYDAPESTLARFRLRYPDHPHNAESLAIHPNGDLFIVTKEYSQDGDSGATAQIFTISARELWALPERLKTLRHIGDIEIPYLLRDFDVFGHVATGMSISPDGTKFLLMTYQKVLEFALNLSDSSRVAAFRSRELVRGRDFQIVTVQQLLQQEAIAYAPIGREAFLYTTEFHGQAPIVETLCQVR